MLLGGGARSRAPRAAPRAARRSTRPVRAQRAVAVERAAAVPRVPQVEQHVARAAVEAAHLAASRRQVGEVGDAADVDDDAVHVGSPNSAAWNAGTSGAPCPPAATSRLRKSATTRMPASSASRAGLLSCSVQPSSGRWRTRLAVARRRRRRRAAATPAPREHVGDRVRIGVGERVGGARRARDLVGAGSLQREQLGAQRGGERHVRGGDRARRPRASAEVGEHGVDAVEARARHQAGEELARMAATARPATRPAASGDRQRARQRELRRRRARCRAANAGRVARRGSGSRAGSATVSGSRCTLATRNS